MPDTNPEYEGDDVHAPHDRWVVAGDTKPAVNLIRPGERTDEQEENRDTEPNEPLNSWMKRSQYLVIDLLVILDGWKPYLGARNVRPPTRTAD